MPPPSSILSLTDLDGTIGAAFIGMVTSAILFGVSNLQLYIYYQQFQNDWIIYRIFVAFLWAFDALNLGLTVHLVYYYSIRHFGNYLALLSVVWSFKLQVITNVIVVVTIQGLYCVRLWKLNYRKTLLPRLVPIIVVLGAGIGFALIIETYKLPSFLEVDNMAWTTYASFGMVGGIDFAIAGTMCYYLRGSRSDFQSTNSRISTLILWTVSTGLATSICSIVALVAFAVMPHKLVYMGLEFLLSKLYFNSFLAMLNTRKRVRDTGTEEYSVHMSSNRTPVITSGGMPFFRHDKPSIPLETVGVPMYGMTKAQDSFVSSDKDDFASTPKQSSQYIDTQPHDAARAV